MVMTNQTNQPIPINQDTNVTIKGGSRRAEKSCKVLMMMMKAAKLGLAGPGAGLEQGWSKARAGLKHEQGSSAGTGQEQS